MAQDYEGFIHRKLSTVPPTGVPHSTDVRLPHSLFDHQEVLTRWALEMGRRFVGVELKASYFQQATRNLDSALSQPSLFACENTPIIHCGGETSVA